MMAFRMTASILDVCAEGLAPSIEHVNHRVAGGAQDGRVARTFNVAARSPDVSRRSIPLTVEDFQGTSGHDS
jgi:hypothetical protein